MLAAAAAVVVVMVVVVTATRLTERPGHHNYRTLLVRLALPDFLQ